jgi:hypothetical protein
VLSLPPASLIVEGSVASKLIRFVIFREGDHWLGQCLEFDLGVQAKTLQEVHRRLPFVLECEMRESVSRYKLPFSGLDAAPTDFRRLWAGRSGEYTPVMAITIPDTTITVGLCDFSPFAGGLADFPTFAGYCAYVTGTGFGVQKRLFVASDGASEIVTTFTASVVSWALEVGTLADDRLAVATLARLDRRLGLRSPFTESRVVVDSRQAC